MSEARIVCQFCETVNPANLKNCQACGAPLEVKETPKEKPVKQARPAPAQNTPAVQNAANLQKARQASEKVEKTATKALYTYSSVLGSLADAFVIALVAFGIGLAGGATSLAAVGVLGAVVLGFAVGSVNKHVYLTILSAPLGFVLGTVVWLPMMFLGLGVKGFVFTSTLGAVLATLLFGKIRPLSQRRTYDRIRPFLGAAGGLAFGLLGMLIGLGLKTVIAPV